MCLDENRVDKMRVLALPASWDVDSLGWNACYDLEIHARELFVYLSYKLSIRSEKMLFDGLVNPSPTSFCCHNINY